MYVGVAPRPALLYLSGMSTRVGSALSALGVRPQKQPRRLRRIVYVWMFLLTAAAFAGCNDAPGDLFVDIRWQVKCPQGAPSCFPSQHRAHDIFTFAGGVTNEDPPLPVALSCLIEPRGADDVLWSFSAVTSEYRLTIRNAIIPRTGGPVSGPDCTVEFVDAVNTYVGKCGSSVLTEAQPCRFSSVGFAYEDRVMGLLGPTLSTSLVCEGVRAPSTAILVRDMTAPDVRGERVNGLIPINIVNCEGIPLN